MSNAQEKKITEFLAQFEKNFKLFEEKFPGILKNIQSIEREIPVRIDEHGETFYLIKNKWAHEVAYKEKVSMLTESFVSDAHRMFVGKFDPESLITDSKEFDEEIFFKPFGVKTRNEILRQHIAQKNESTHASSKPLSGLAIHMGLTFAPALISALEKIKVGNIVIIENSFDNIWLSLFTIDYHHLVSKFSNYGQGLYIFAEQNIDASVAAIFKLLYEDIPPFYIQSAIYTYDGEEPEQSLNLAKKLFEHKYRAFATWGFVDDEILGLQQTAKNIISGIPVFQPSGIAIPKGASAIIVGNGPSLDSLIDFIRINKNSAIIVSCGSSLSPLLKHGITPDFHLEIERTIFTTYALVEMLGANAKASFPIIGTILMHSGAFELTNTPLAMLKTIDTATRVCDPDEKITPVVTNPTCTNGGVDLCIKLGFDNIYLVGIDVGYIDKKNHHSKDSIYYKKDDITNPEFMQIITTQEFGDDIEIKGNLREKVYSTEDFIGCKNVLSNSIINCGRQINAYNLNDGAFIHGAAPVHEMDRPMIAATHNKKDIINQIQKHFSPLRKSEFKKNIIDLNDLINYVVDDLNKIISAHASDSPSDVLNLITSIFQYISSPRFNRLAINPLFRGTFMDLMNLTYLCSIESTDADSSRLVNALKNALITVTRETQIRIRSIIDSLN